MTYPFFILNKLNDFTNFTWIFFQFFFKTSFLRKKNQIILNVLWNQKHPKFVKLRWSFKISILRNSYGSWKISKFIRNDKWICHLKNDYFFLPIIKLFLALLLCKIFFFWQLWNGCFFFRFLLYRDVVKFWSNQIFGWECMYETLDKNPALWFKNCNSNI